MNDDDEKGAWDSIICVLYALEARMSLMIREGEVGAVGTTDEAVMGYYVVKWLSEPYALQTDTEGMSGVINAGAMVVDGIFSTGFSVHHIGTRCWRKQLSSK